MDLQLLLNPQSRTPQTTQIASMDRPTLDSLPAEICRMIVAHLPETCGREDLMNLSLISRTFLPIAREPLFRRQMVRFTPESVVHKANICDCPSLADYVRHLKVDASSLFSMIDVHEMISKDLSNGNMLEWLRARVRAILARLPALETIELWIGPSESEFTEPWRATNRVDTIFKHEFHGLLAMLHRSVPKLKKLAIESWDHYGWIDTRFFEVSDPRSTRVRNLVGLFSKLQHLSIHIQSPALYGLENRPVNVRALNHCFGRMERTIETLKISFTPQMPLGCLIQCGPCTELSGGVKQVVFSELFDNVTFRTLHSLEVHGIVWYPKTVGDFMKRHHAVANRRLERVRLSDWDCECRMWPPEAIQQLVTDAGGVDALKPLYLDCNPGELRLLCASQRAHQNSRPRAQLYFSVAAKDLVYMANSGATSGDIRYSLTQGVWSRPYFWDTEETNVFYLPPEETEVEMFRRVERQVSIECIATAHIGVDECLRRGRIREQLYIAYAQLKLREDPLGSIARYMDQAHARFMAAEIQDPPDESTGLIPTPRPGLFHLRADGVFIMRAVLLPDDFQGEILFRDRFPQVTDVGTAGAVLAWVRDADADAMHQELQRIGVLGPSRGIRKQLGEVGIAIIDRCYYTGRSTSIHLDEGFKPTGLDFTIRSC